MDTSHVSRMTKQAPSQEAPRKPSLLRTLTTPFRWIDKQESPAMTGFAYTVLAAAFLWVLSLFWKHIASAIPALASLLVVMRTEVQVELWMLGLCLIFPLLAVGSVYRAHQRKIKRLESRIALVAGAVVNPLGVGILERVLEREKKP